MGPRRDGGKSRHSPPPPPPPGKIPEILFFAILEAFCHLFSMWWPFCYVFLHTGRSFHHVWALYVTFLLLMGIILLLFFLCGGGLSLWGLFLAAPSLRKVLRAPIWHHNYINVELSISERYGRDGERIVNAILKAPIWPIYILLRCISLSAILRYISFSAISPSPL